MSQDPNEETYESKSEKLQAMRVQETFSALAKMEHNLQKLINKNTANTLQLMKTLQTTTASEMDDTPEISHKSVIKLTSKTETEWKPPNPQQCAMAVTNPIPYTKSKLPIPSKTSIIGIITDHKYWNKFFAPKIAPQYGDWLESHTKDRTGQTFMQYYNRKPTYPSHKLDTIGLITIGKFDINLHFDLKSESKTTVDDEKYTKQTVSNNLFTMLSAIVQAYYGMNVQIMDSIPCDGITSRHNNGTGAKQLLTTDIHDRLTVIKEKKKQLFCLMGVSIIDLYPKDSWSFVFGQARIKAGTGVFSFARYIPDFDEIQMLQYDSGYGLQSVDVNKVKLLKRLVDGEEMDKDILGTLEFDQNTQILFFRRCIKVLVHEIGHLFGIKHCVYFECIMNGSNSESESDMKPVYLCPVCLHKLYFCRLKKCKPNQTDYKPLDVLQRYERLAELYDRYGLVEDAKWYKERVQFLKDMK